MAWMSGTRGFAIGFTTGFGAGLLARDALPHIKSALAPAMKFVLRTSMEAAERTREMAARFGEAVQDTVAEVRMEMKEQGFGSTLKSRRASSKKRKTSRMKAVKPTRVMKARKAKIHEPVLHRAPENVVELKSPRVVS